MIKEEKVLVKVNSRNKNIYKNLGYEIYSEILVNISDIPHGSKVKVTAICDICNSEKIISYSKYLVNKNRNDKNYYSCFGCKNIEKEKTSIKKWGVRSYSMTDEFKTSESKKWKGIKKGHEKSKKTMLERYGVDSYFKTDLMREMNSKWMSSDEFKEKSKSTIMFKYGVDSYSKTDEFKSTINLKMDLTIDKIKKIFFEKYGSEYLSKTEYWKNIYSSKRLETIDKIKITCLERYGVDNISKLNCIQDKIKSTKISNGTIIDSTFLDNWILYKNEVRKYTNRVKKKLYEDWDGTDYYDNELIKGYLSNTHTHRFYPSIDHKISVYYGFINNIPSIEVGDVTNLCITKRFINSSKSKMIEDEFIKSNRIDSIKKGI